MDLVSVSLEWIWNRQRRLAVSFNFCHYLVGGGLQGNWCVVLWVSGWMACLRLADGMKLHLGLWQWLIAGKNVLCLSVFYFYLQRVNESYMLTTIWPGMYEACHDSAIKFLKTQTANWILCHIFAGMLICSIWKCPQSITIWSRLIKHQTGLHK